MLTIGGDAVLWAMAGWLCISVVWAAHGTSLGPALRLLRAIHGMRWTDGESALAGCAEERHLRTPRQIARAGRAWWLGGRAGDAVCPRAARPQSAHAARPRSPSGSGKRSLPQSCPRPCLVRRAGSSLAAPLAAPSRRARLLHPWLCALAQPSCPHARCLYRPHRSALGEC